MSVRIKKKVTLVGQDLGGQLQDGLQVAGDLWEGWPGHEQLQVPVRARCGRARWHAGHTNWGQTSERIPAVHLEFPCSHQQIRDEERLRYGA